MILHLYDYTDNWMRRWGYAAEYCEEYVVATGRCGENTPGTEHAGVASLEDVRSWIQHFGSVHQTLDGLSFHTHGNRGYVHLPNGGIDKNNVGQLQNVCATFLAAGAIVTFFGCNVGEGTEGRDFLIAAGTAMLSHGGGWIYTCDSVTFSAPEFGQRQPIWSNVVTAHVYAGGIVEVRQ